MREMVRSALFAFSPRQAWFAVRLARLVAWLPLPPALWWVRALAGARPGLEAEAARVAAELL